MTEPSGGSDVKAVRTTVLRDDDHYVLSGAKTFISNATVCDLVIVVAKTDPTAGAKGVSCCLWTLHCPALPRVSP